MTVLEIAPARLAKRYQCGLAGSLMLLSFEPLIALLLEGPLMPLFIAPVLAGLFLCFVFLSMLLDDMAPPDIEFLPDMDEFDIDEFVCMALPPLLCARAAPASVTEAARAAMPRNFMASP
jgi:hypothetical protein